MEVVKEIIRQFYQLMIVVSCVLFVMWIFFSAQIHHGTGVFEGVGTLFAQVVDRGKIRNEGIRFIQDEVSDYVPSVTYVGGTKQTGDVCVLKEQFLVRKEDGSWVTGSLEDEFSIFLLDIRDLSGNSVMINMKEEEIAGMMDIPTVFVYESKQDMLYCFSNGIYIVRIKICGMNGEMNVYEFQLPVESS